MKKLIILFLIILNSQNSFAQQYLSEGESQITYAFYLKISKGNIPTVASKSINKVILKDKNIRIQSVFNKYVIHEFIKAFPNAKNVRLQDIYYLRTNKRELVNELRNNYKDVYYYDEEIGEIDYLLQTNDYGLVSGGSQRNLDLINAKEAWDYTTGDPNVLVGISDLAIKTTHEDLVGKIVGYTNTNGSPSGHGTEVAGVVAANTNNGIGLSAIGYNIRLLYAYYDAYNPGLPNMWSLYQSGAKIINGSWYSACRPYSEIDQLAINEMYNNGTVIIFAAGNTSTCGSSKDNPIYPAAYDNVISVTSVGTRDVGFTYNGIQLEWRDRVENLIGDYNSTHHLNNLVDMAAPGHAILVPTNYNSQNYRTVWGTSTAAPHVSGTVGLMFSANPSLNPNEIETILKLTSSNLDSISENQSYIDKMGAGRLDAHKAVKMAYKMAQTNDFIEIKNRDFYRNWSFELANAPYGIKISHQKFRDSIKVDFKSRNYISLEHTVLDPMTNEGISLSIDPLISIPQSNKSSKNVTSPETYNNSFFKDKTYKLKYFLKNGVEEELDLTNPNDPSGNTSRGTPIIYFHEDSESDVLNADITGYCNETSAKFTCNDTYFDTISRGASTLSDCGGDEETDYFSMVTGNSYLQTPSNKVFFEVTDNEEGLWLWSQENHKLYFSLTSLSTNENTLANSIQIYPNPANDFVYINYGNNIISEITVIDLEGKEIVKKIDNFEKIDISKLPTNYYFLKITNSNNITITKKIIKQ